MSSILLHVNLELHRRVDCAAASGMIGNSHTLPRSAIVRMHPRTDLALGVIDPQVRDTLLAAYLAVGQLPYLPSCAISTHSRYRLPFETDGGMIIPVAQAYLRGIQPAFAPSENFIIRRRLSYYLGNVIQPIRILFDAASCAAKETDI